VTQQIVGGEPLDCGFQISDCGFEIAPPRQSSVRSLLMDKNQALSKIAAIESIIDGFDHLTNKPCG
jgi:hypothetical protein